MKQWLEKLQPIGRALMLPIAVLPIAGLLLRVGQPDLLNVAFIAAAGEAIFANLGLMFAIGVAVGLARVVDLAQTLRSADMDYRRVAPRALDRLFDVVPGGPV